MSDTDNAAPVARLGYWLSGGRDYVRATDLSGESYNVSRGGVANTDGAADPANIGAWRPEGGRWRSSARDYRADDGLAMVVELTQTELTELVAGRVPRAAWVRITRAIEAGITIESYHDELPDRCRVSNRGRHGSAKTPAPAPDVLPDPILRPNGVPYYPRPIGGTLCVDLVRRIHEQGRSVMFYGAPGTGKTACLEAAFTEQTTSGPVARFEYVPGTSDTEAADFVGTYVPEPGGTYRWVDGPLLRAMENGLPLIIDEIALIDPRALAIVYAAMDGRGEVYVTANPLRGTVHATAGFGVHSACNPDAPGAQMSEALTSRHTAQVEYGTDYALAEQWVDAGIVAIARNLDRKRIEGEVTWSPQMRELIAFAEMAKLFDQGVAMANLVSCAPAVDRPVVADVISRMSGTAVTPLAIRDGGQA